jgi:hypothetical protein
MIEKIMTGIIIAATFALIIASASAHIEIRELWTEEWDQRGFIDYKNTVEQNTTGLITIYIDNKIVLEQPADMHVMPFHGFLINRPEKLEFALNMTSGEHNVTAYINSRNVTVNASCSYYCEEKKQEEEPKPLDWLPCPCGGT